MVDKQVLHNIQEAIGSDKHPAIATNLIGLGLLKDSVVENFGKSALTLGIPFPNVPEYVQDFLIKRINSSVTSAMSVKKVADHHRKRVIPLVSRLKRLGSMEVICVKSLPI